MTLSTSHNAVTRHSVLCVVVLAFSALASPLTAAEFLLRNPDFPFDPQQQGMVTVSAQEAVLVLGDGPQTRFIRNRQQDDQYSIGYIDLPSRTILRWPRDTRGAIFLVYPALNQVTRMPWQIVPLQNATPRPTRQIRIVDNPPLPPVEIEFTNKHTEPLICQLIDRRGRGMPVKFTIEPGRSVTTSLNRDAGKTRQIVSVAPTGEVLGVINEVQIPAEELYDVTVYENSVQSTYIDRTGKDNFAPVQFRAPSQTRSPRSVGVFTLPADEGLKNNSRVDVYASARRAGNPGAASNWTLPLPRN